METVRILQGYSGTLHPISIYAGLFSPLAVDDPGAPTHGRLFGAWGAESSI